MKFKTLIPILLLTATNVSAQRWNVGLNAGALVSTRLEAIDGYKFSGINPTLSLDVSYNLNSKWRGGISLDYQRLASKFDDYEELENNFNPSTGLVIQEHVTFKTYRPTYSLVGRFARVFNIHKFQYSIGVSAGYYRLYESDAKRNTASEKLTGGIFGTDGIRGGLQVGARYALADHWALNGTLNGDCFLYPASTLMPNKSFVSGSLNFGVVYTF